MTHACDSYPVIDRAQFDCTNAKSTRVGSVFGHCIREWIMVLTVFHNQWDTCAVHWRKLPSMNYVTHLFADASTAILEWCRCCSSTKNIYSLISYWLYIFITAQRVISALGTELDLPEKYNRMELEIKLRVLYHASSPNSVYMLFIWFINTSELQDINDDIITHPHFKSCWGWGM